MFSFKIGQRRLIEYIKFNPIMPGGGGGGLLMPAPSLNSSQISDNLRQSFHIIGLFLKFIWQFGDVVGFWLWGLMLS